MEFNSQKVSFRNQCFIMDLLSPTCIQLDNNQKQHLYNLMMNFKLTCQTYGIPCFISCVVGNDAEKTEYLRECYDAGSHKICLSNDQIARHILVSNGAQAIIPRAVMVQGEPNWDEVMEDEILEDDEL